MGTQQNHRVQRLIAIFIVGVCNSIRTGAVSIDEAESLLFSPYTIRRIEQIGASNKIVELIHAGTELDAVKRIVSEQEFMRSLENMISQALSFLSETEACDPQLEKWIEQIIRDFDE